MYTVLISVDDTDNAPYTTDTVEKAMHHLLHALGVYPVIDVYGGVEEYELLTQHKISGAIFHFSHTVFKARNY